MSSLTNRARVTGMLVVGLILMLPGLGSAMQPPRPGELENYAQDGTLSKRIEDSLKCGNHLTSPRLVWNLKSKLMKAAGKSDVEIAANIGFTPPPDWRGGLPSSGTPKTFVLLVDFPEYPHTAGQTQADVDSKFFGDGTPTDLPYESLRNYYQRSSYSKLTIQGTVFDWYRAQHSRAYYQGLGFGPGEEVLMMEALDHWNALGHDFTQYDNDNDGTIDGFFMKWTGPDNGWANFWWAYQWSWHSYPSYSIDGKSFGSYVWSWIANVSYDGRADYYPRTDIHETGHLLGLPDLYDYDGSVGPDGGVGGLDMMHANWGDHNCFSKYMLDWLEPTQIVSGSQTIALNPSGTSKDCVQIMPAITPGTMFSEFFMAQYRKRSTGNDPSNYPTDGLLIWHIDSTLNASGNNFLWDNSYTAHKYTRLMEADGLEQIEQNSSANAGDFYVPGKSFGNNTTPKSQDYSGQATGVSVDQLTAPGSTMTARFQLLVAPDITGTSSIALEGCQPANGVIDPFEQVTLDIQLQNIGLADTANLVATLQPTGGVTQPTGPQTYGLLQAGGAAVTRSFSFLAGGGCGENLTVTLQLQDGATDLGTLALVYTLGARQVTLSENFDAVTTPALPANWTATVGQGAVAPWATSTIVSDTPANAAFATNPDIISDNYLVSPSIAIVTASAQLSFRHGYILESGYDGGVLEIAFGAGSFTDIITAGGSFLVGGYNAVVNTCCGNPIGGRNAWSGNSGEFITTTVNLPATAAGQSVRFRWRLGSDNMIEAAGWFVDTVTLKDEVICCQSEPGTRIISLTGDLAFGEVVVGSSVQRTLAIGNSGDSTLTVSGISYPSGFSGNWSGGTIAAGSSQNVTVTFSPTAMTSYGGTVSVSSNKTSGVNTIAASGTGSDNRTISLSGNLAFDEVMVGSSEQRTLTISNIGDSMLTVSGISYPSGFSGNWSGGTIAAGSSRDVTVTFSPTMLTSYGGTVTVNSDKTAGANTISASGIGSNVIIRVISLSGNLVFGDVLAGSSSLRTLTISNSGVSALYVSGINYPSGFSGNWSGGTIAAGSSQQVTVTFSPTEQIGYGGTITVNSNKTGGTNTISASGTGNGIAVRFISLSGDLAFGDVSVGLEVQRTLTIGNIGNSALTVDGISYPSGFSGNWSGSIAAGSSRQVTVVFSPTAQTVYGGTVTVNSNKTGGTNTIPASGTGTVTPTRVISLSGDMVFDEVLIGSSGQRTLTIGNSGNSALTVSGISYPNGFSGNWSGSIAVGSSQGVTVTFSPTAQTSYSGSITVNSDKTSGTNAIAASGTGTAPNPPDTTSPMVAISNPTSYPTYTTAIASIDIGGTASDNVGVTQVSWSNDRGGDGTCTGTTNWINNGIALQSGQNVITVTAKDAANNSATDTLTVTYSPPAPSYTITTSTLPLVGGTTQGGGTFTSGQSCTVIASANSGYSFTKWTENGTQVSTLATYKFTVKESRNLLANFAPICSITATASPSAGGKTSGNGTYASGQSCTVGAYANAGYSFSGWTENGAQVSASAIYTFTVTGSRTLSANFAAACLVAVGASPLEGGTTSGGGTYISGQSCTVTASANSGYRFTNWTENGSPVSTSASFTFTASGARSLVANFTATSSPSDSPSDSDSTYIISAGSSPAVGGATNGGGTYAGGQNCTVSASSNSGYTFVNWTENGSPVSTSASYTFAVTGNRALVANFTLSVTTTYTLWLEDPSGQSVPQTYTAGTSVSVTAPAAPEGQYFAYWSGDVSGLDNPITVVMNRDKNIRANYESCTEQPPSCAPGTSVCAAVTMLMLGLMRLRRWGA